MNNKVVFDWEEAVNYWFKKEAVNYWFKKYAFSPLKDITVIEIEKVCKNNIYGYVVYYNFISDKECDIYGIFKTLEDAKKFADEALSEAGIKTLGDEYKVLI
jgi:hypothetical protein